ncbi:MAG: hypothetical protein G01um10148_207 [Parcubacteria group bacterium Gr01-1014_8]|nr:MAG: hypothetical protein G01um10148_207 [Parcubacteria group bacterium Gr01-1014_8]
MPQPCLPLSLVLLGSHSNLYLDSSPAFFRRHYCCGYITKLPAATALHIFQRFPVLRHLRLILHSVGHENTVSQQKTPGVGVFVALKSLFWRLATLALRLPSPQLGLTTVFGMRTGVTPAINHQNKNFNCNELCLRQPKNDTMQSPTLACASFGEPQKERMRFVTSQ